MRDNSLVRHAIALAPDTERRMLFSAAWPLLISVTATGTCRRHQHRKQMSMITSCWSIGGASPFGCGDCPARRRSLSEYDARSRTNNEDKA